MSTSLNEKQKAFCDYYLIDFNATQAAIKAGYSKKTAKVIGHQLLNKTLLQKYLAEKKQKLAAKLEVSQERTLLEISRIAFSDIRKLFDDDGNLVNLKTLDDDTAAAISSIETDTEITENKAKKNTTTKTLTRKLKLWSKSDGLEMLGKHFGLFKADNDQQKPDPVDLTKLSAAELKAFLSLRKKMQA